ncbi:MAG: biotin/lipoate A/B protein ligase family protein [Solirubrobacterales bacterium]
MRRDEPRRPGGAGPVVLDTRESPRPAAVEIAISHALLNRVGAGQLPPLIRVYRPVPTVAFGRLDAHRDGYGDAIEAARRHGFEPAMRLAGGRAAAYHRGSLVCEEISAEEGALAGVGDRFARFSRHLWEALTALGANVAIGELPNEYCPGRHSLHVGGRVKVAGIAQRATRRAALTSASLVVRDATPLRQVLQDVYGALSIELDPATVGSLEEELPGIRVEVVAAELIARLHGDAEVVTAGLDAGTNGLAAELLPRHKAEPLDCLDLGRGNAELEGGRLQ